ncbi:hypothetical protein [Actinoplanes solisilvae]|uniref:hypothetical protein n=1 Tax=Actinoplanes solisilvae TaxID=2486853 RepID=UPI000FDC7312|nr:hypothetical protein [Actinoplanes solisilvae]
MLYPILILAVITAICVLGGRYLPDLNSSAWGRKEAPSAAQPGAVAYTEPESLEGVLVAQLVAGEITTSQYRRSGTVPPSTHRVRGQASRAPTRSDVRSSTLVVLFAVLV